MNRELAKKKAMSRDCHCVKGKDRDNNYNSIIDEIFDWHESEVENLALSGVSQQRELLEGFVDWFNINDKTQAILSERIEEYLKTL